MKQPRRLVEHAHWALGESLSDHLFDLTDSGELSAFTRLLKLDLAGEKTPENLRDELIVGVGLSAKDLLQDEKVVVGVYSKGE